MLVLGKGAGRELGWGGAGLSEATWGTDVAKTRARTRPLSGPALLQEMWTPVETLSVSQEREHVAPE